MSMPETSLDVFEYNGTARSGKGTIVAALAEFHPDVATDETGADYRAITLGLMIDNALEAGMPQQRVDETVKELSVDVLTDYAARRKEIVEELGKDALYTPELNSVLPFVSPHQAVRKAVKGGFAKRVEAVRDDGKHSVLLVDGRNLASVIEGIDNTNLVLRTFVYCLPIEAARRECLRSSELQPETPEWHDAMKKNYDLIVDRNNTDKNRTLDPVVPENDAIRYWESSSLMTSTIDLHARLLFDGDVTAALQHMFSRDRDFTDIPREGAGLKAVAEGRQIYFDTTPFASYDYPGSKHSMVLAASNMFAEALRARQILNGRA